MLEKPIFSHFTSSSYKNICTVGICYQQYTPSSFKKKKKKQRKTKNLYCLFMDFKLLKSSRVQMQVFLGWNELLNLYGSGDKIIKSGCWKFS